LVVLIIDIILISVPVLHTGIGVERGLPGMRRRWGVSGCQLLVAILWLPVFRQPSTGDFIDPHKDTEFLLTYQVPGIILHVWRLPPPR